MQWTIGKKLGAGFGVMVAIIVVVAGTVYYNLRGVTQIQATVVEQRQPAVLAATNILNGINDSLASLRGYMILGGQKMRDGRANAWKSMNSEVATLKTLSKNWNDPQQIKSLKELETVLGEFSVAQQTIEDICQTDDNLPASKMLFLDAAPLADVMLKSVTAIIDEEKTIEPSVERRALLANLADTRGSLAVGLAAIRAYLLSGDEKFAETFRTKWQINTARFASLQEQIELFTESQANEFAKYSEGRTNFAPLPEKMISLRGSKDWNVANKLLGTEAAPRGARAKQLIGNIVQSQQALASTDVTNLQNQSATLTTTVIVLSLIGSVIGIGVAWVVTNGIVKPINETVAVLEKVASGDLTQRLDIATKDELGRMATALNSAVESSAKTLEEVKIASEREQQAQQERAKVEKDQREKEAQLEAEQAQREREEVDRQQQKEQAEAQREREEAATKQREADQLRSRINDILTVVTAAAEGDLTQNVTVDGDQAIDELAAGINKMLRDLSGVICDVADGASQFTEGSRVISESSQSMAQGAQVQSASVEEMSASIEELARSIETVKENARSANDVALSTSRLAEQGGSAVEKANEAMARIRSSSIQIADIINVISDIARQTNLLALNAAIEAARAGEHGLGFAVVADEVRKLAERSNEAAGEVNSLIKESTNRVEEGARLSEETGVALEKIVAGVSETADWITSIAGATVEQATNANEVANAIQGVSQITEQAAASSEELASSSEELGAQASTLNQLTQRFKTSGSESTVGDTNYQSTETENNWSSEAQYEEPTYV